jgi:hypothetical protein
LGHERSGRREKGRHGTVSRKFGAKSIANDESILSLFNFCLCLTDGWVEEGGQAVKIEGQIKGQIGQLFSCDWHLIFEFQPKMASHR